MTLNKNGCCFLLLECVVLVRSKKYVQRRETWDTVLQNIQGRLVFRQLAVPIICLTHLKNPEVRLCYSSEKGFSCFTLKDIRISENILRKYFSNTFSGYTEKRKK